MRKLIALSSIALLALTACDLEKKCYCLDTFNDVDYQTGYCMQMSKKDVFEYLYVFCLPSNPEDSPENYRYEISWNGKENTNTNHFTFVGGLAGKKVNEVYNLNEHTLRINVTGACIDQEAAFGYLKVSREAFKSHGENSKDAVLLAYIAIGEKTGASVKPEDVTWKK